MPPPFAIFQIRCCGQWACTSTNCISRILHFHRPNFYCSTVSANQSLVSINLRSFTAVVLSVRQIVLSFASLSVVQSDTLQSTAATLLRGDHPRVSRSPTQQAIEPCLQPTMECEWGTDCTVPALKLTRAGARTTRDDPRVDTARPRRAARCIRRRCAAALTQCRLAPQRTGRPAGFITQRPLSPCTPTLDRHDSLWEATGTPTAGGA